MWLDGGPGAGDLVDQILIYPDCTSATPWQCTRLIRTDTTNYYIWKPCTTPSCIINGTTNDGGYGWVPAPLPLQLTNSQLTAIVGNSAFGQIQSGSIGMAACAWTTDQAQSVPLAGSTSDIYLILTSVMGGATYSGEIFTTTNKGASWTATGQAVLLNPQGGNNQNVRTNSPIVWCDPNSNGQVAYVGQWGAQTLVTTNGGASWITVGGLPLPASGAPATEIVGDPTSTVINNVTQRLYAWVANYGLYVTTNAGTNWSAVSSVGAPSAIGNPSGVQGAGYPIKIDKFGQVWIEDFSTSPTVYKYSGGGAGGMWSTTTTLCPAGEASFLSFDSTSTSAATERIYSTCTETNYGPFVPMGYSSNGGNTWSSLEALQSASVSTPGTGCTNGSQTFTVSGGTAIAAATFTATVSGGMVTGTPTINVPGSYAGPPSGNPSATGGGCTTAPTIAPVWTYGFIQSSTQSDVPWLSDGPSQKGQIDNYDSALDMAGNLILAGGYGVFYGSKTSLPIIRVQSVGFESSTNGNVVVSARGLGFSQTSWDTGLFANFVPALYAYNNFAGSTPTFAVQSPAVAGLYPWITCMDNGAPWDGCSMDGGHTFTQWKTAPPGPGPMATIDGKDILVLTGGKLYCNTTGGAGTWTALSGVPGDSPTVFEKSAGVYEYALSAYNVNGEWTSSGGCAGTWTEVSTSQATSVSIGVPGQVGLIIQGGTQTYPSISTDGGVSWKLLGGGYPFETLGGISVGAGKPGAKVPYTIYNNGYNASGILGTWQSTDGGTTWQAVSSYGLNGYFGMIFEPAGLAADPDIYGVVESAVNNMGNSVIGTTDSCPAVYWNPKVTYPTENVTGTVTLTAQDVGLAAPTSISFNVDGKTIATFTPTATAASYSYNWNSGTVAAGVHTLAVVSNGNGCVGVSKSIPITTH